MFHVGSIPMFKSNIRKQYMYNLEDKHGEFDECTVFGVSCVKGRAPVFHCMLPNGAIYYRVPLQAFTSDEKAEELTVNETYFWDSFSYYFAVHRFDFLREMDCIVLLKNKKQEKGMYMFTIDWCDPDGTLVSSHAEIPDEHKCHHIIHLDSGNYVAYPNNRILWQEASFVVRDEIPDYKTNTHNWYGEERFITEDTDKMFYKTKKEIKDSK